MIKARAHRDTKTASSSGYDDYVEKEPKSGNRVAFGFLLFIMGCVAFIKSCVPFSVGQTAEKQAPADHAAKEDEPAADAPPPETDQAAVASEEEPDGSTGSDKKYTSNVIPLTALSRFKMAADEVDSLLMTEPPLDFRDLTRSPFTTISTSGEFIRPVNDNRSEGNHSGGQVGGGGGGGGGGSDPRPTDPNTGPKPPVNPPGPDPHRNRAPRVESVVQLRDLIGCQLYFIPIVALLAGASDADGDTLRAIHVRSSSGTLTPVDGGWNFVPAFGWLGEVTLAYSISDGTASVRQVAHFNVVEAPPIIGTDQADNLLGTQCGETIDGRKGDDNIDAREGNDIVLGGDGDDHINGGAGNDVIYAGAGDDIVFAGSGNDVVFGGSGNDRLFGEDGDDALLGEDGDDLLVGGAGADLLVGGAGNDVALGETGNDKLEGGGGDDKLDGGLDNDILVGGDGKDTLLGGDGNDTLAGGDDDDNLDGGGGDDVLEGGAGNDAMADGGGEDVVHGGAGNDLVAAAADASDDVYAGDAGSDVLDYSATTLGVVIDIGEGVAEGEEIGRDQISGFEAVIGGRGNDRINSGHGSISMTGGEGNDTFEFEEPGQDNRGSLVRTITDFTVGDRLLVSGYEFHDNSDHGNGDNEDAFRGRYLVDDDNHRKVRFRFEKHDDLDVTVVSVSDGIPDGEYDIQLFGRHVLDVQDNV
jgi:Ca2+-binding RTX toxin-like protein